MKIVNLICDQCHDSFERAEKYIKRDAIRHKSSFCTRKCRDTFWKRSTTKICCQCLNTLEVSQASIRKSKTNNFFCSRSCAAKYNNSHKTKGTRVSKLEAWLQIKLVEKHPTLDFHFNRKDSIESELDIYIPSLKLAFELNGIFHYQPIYGQEKLNQIISNDNRKFETCQKQGIELYIIDSSLMTYFKESKALDYFTTIDKKISQSKMIVSSVSRAEAFLYTPGTTGN